MVVLYMSHYKAVDRKILLVFLLFVFLLVIQMNLYSLSPKALISEIIIKQTYNILDKYLPDKPDSLWQYDIAELNKRRKHVSKVIDIHNMFRAKEFERIFDTIKDKKLRSESDRIPYINILKELWENLYCSLSEEEKLSLEVAVILHDIGYFGGFKSWTHNVLGADRAVDELSGLNYIPDNMISLVSKIIYRHGNFTDVGVDILINEILQLPSSIKNMVLLMTLFDGMGKNRGNIISLNRLKNILLLEDKLNDYEINNNFYYFRLHNACSPTVFIDIFRNNILWDRSFKYLQNNCHFNVESKEFKNFILNWNKKIRIYIFPLFMATIEHSPKLYARLVRLISLLTSEFRYIYEWDEWILDTDIDIMLMSNNERLKFFKFIWNKLESMPDNIDESWFRDELEKNNYTSIIGIPIHRSLKDNKIIIDTERFFRKCPLCSSRNNPEMLFRKQSWQSDELHHYNVMKCLDCGIIFNNISPSKEELEKYYSLGYFQKLPGEEEEEDGYHNYLVTSEANMRIEGFKNQFEYLNSEYLHLKEGNVLDIGSGAGYFLKAVNDFHGWKGVGLEVSKDIVLSAIKKFGFEFNVYNFILEDALKRGVIKENSQDMVTFFNTFEHLKDPENEIKNVYKVLRIGGVAVFYLPNILSKAFIEHGDKFSQLNYGHLFSFSKDRFKRFLEENGFKILSIKTITQEYSEKEKEAIEVKGLGEFMYVVARKMDVYKRNNKVQIAA